ncbi:MAG: hypothetical protein LH609_01225 [Rudanella sp.]|nr:hypothetical protein [Rudanella sp.]
MNQTFASARFGRLLRKYWQEDKAGLTAALGTLFATQAATMFFLGYSAYPDSLQANRAIGFLSLSLIIWPLFTVAIASVYNKRDQGLSLFMVPASLFEKWLQLWLVSGLLFMVCFVGFFSLIDVFGTYYINHKTWSAEELSYLSKNNIPRTVELFDYADLLRTPIWAVWVLLHPFSLAATLLFRKYPLIVGVGVGMTLFGGSFILNNQLVNVLLDDARPFQAFPFADVWAYNNKLSVHGHYLTLPQPIGDIIRWGVGIAAVGLLYAVAYFRLKEREV